MLNLRNVAAALLVASATAQTVTDLILVNTATGKDIMILNEGSVVDLKTMGNQLSVRAQVSGTPKFVAMTFNDKFTRVEQTAPYYLAGVSEDTKKPWGSHSLAQPGPHAIKACPQSDTNVGKIDAASTRRQLQTSGCLIVNFDTAEDASTFTGFSSVTIPSTDIPGTEGDLSGVVQGDLMQYHTVTVAFSGPPASEAGMTIPGNYREPSTFADYKMDCQFKLGSKTILVPGYYAGDGNAGNDSTGNGSIWQCHFTPDATGTWSYTASFRQGTNVAQNGGGNPGFFFDGSTGTFTVTTSNKTGKDLRARARLTKDLTIAGKVQFFVGLDSPENLLAFDDFDNTPNNNGYLKSYAAHDADYTYGEPTFANGKGMALIGAVDYLASKGINIITVTLLNADGSDGNVYPYVQKDNVLRYDISKLAQWKVIFDYAATLGIAIRFQLTDAASDNFLDQGNLYEDRMLFYREMVARFGHHPACIWDIGEGVTDKQASERSAYIRSIDPYDSPIAVRSLSASYAAISTLDIVSASSSITSTKPNLMISASMASEIENPDFAAQRRALYSGLLSGNSVGIQYFFGPSTLENDLTLQDFRSRDTLLTASGLALGFVSSNNIAVGAGMPCVVTTGSLCMDDGSGSVVIYKGATDNAPGFTSTAVSKTYTVNWYNPRTGGALQTGSVASVAATAGTQVAIGLPPSETTADWVALLK